MHNKLIQLADKPVNKDDYIQDIDICEDALVLQESDYLCDEESFEEAYESIKNDFKDVATVNKEKRTITFKDRKTIKRMWVKHIKKVTSEALAGIKEDHFDNSERKLRREMNEPFGLDGIYHYDYCRKAGSLIADYLDGFIPQTVHIGAIIDYHF